MECYVKLIIFIAVSALLTDSKRHDSDSDSDSESGGKKMIQFRRCEPCPREMAMNPTNPHIIWICGVYQKAKRSFKSECMMQYRNCQDGTLFVKLHNYRCPDVKKGGRHWFYPSSESESEESDWLSGGFSQ